MTQKSVEKQKSDNLSSNLVERNQVKQKFWSFNNYRDQKKVVAAITAAINHHRNSQ